MQCCCAKPLVLRVELMKPSSIGKQLIWQCPQQEFSAVAMDVGYLLNQDVTGRNISSCCARAGMPTRRRRR